MKIIRKAIYPSPCSLPFLPFLLALFAGSASRLSLAPSLPPSPAFPLLSLYPVVVVFPYYFIHTLNGNRVPVSDERLVPVPDGNRGTFIRRANRPYGNNLLYNADNINNLVFSRARYTRRVACLATFNYRHSSSHVSFVTRESRIFNNSLSLSLCVLDETPNVCAGGEEIQILALISGEGILNFAAIL